MTPHFTLSESSHSGNKTSLLDCSLHCMFHIAFPAPKADPKMVLWKSILWVQQLWKSQEHNSQNRVLLYHHQCITKGTEMKFCGAVGKYLTILAQHHHFSINFLSWACCILLLLASAPEKANSFQAPQSQVKGFCSLIPFQPVKTNGVGLFVIHAFTFWSYQVIMQTSENTQKGKQGKKNKLENY